VPQRYKAMLLRNVKVAAQLFQKAMLHLSFYQQSLMLKKNFGSPKAI
jgi:hypothetical protein